MINDDNGVRRVRWTRTHDGDTFFCMMDVCPVMRPRPWFETSIRMYGWFIAELNEEEGPFMRDVFDTILREATEHGSILTVKMKARSFERIVCQVFIDDQLLTAILGKTLAMFRAADVIEKDRMKHEVAHRLEHAIKPRLSMALDDGEDT